VKYALLRNLWFAANCLVAMWLLASCGTTTSPLPRYENPLAKTDFQNVRTTAYTHTESDHLPYGDHNALGGQLHSASAPVHRAENIRRALPVDDASDYQQASYPEAQLQPFTMGTARSRPGMLVPARYGSAAADWSRWPAGTTFRLLSTGQIYQSLRVLERHQGYKHIRRMVLELRGDEQAAAQLE